MIYLCKELRTGVTIAIPFSGREAGQVNTELIFSQNRTKNKQFPRSAVVNGQLLSLFLEHFETAPS